MNGPLFAAIIVAATVAFAIWFAWYGIYEPPVATVLNSLFAWSLPLFYAGGWAAGYTLGETTAALMLTIFFAFLGWLRHYGVDFIIEVFRNLDEPDSDEGRQD